MTGKPTADPSNELMIDQESFPGQARVEDQLDGLSPQLAELGASLTLRFRATDDAEIARPAIRSAVMQAMQEVTANEPKIEGAGALDVALASMPPSSVSVKQGPQHARTVNYTPDPKHPEQLAPGEFLEIWHRFKHALKTPTITGEMVAVLMHIRPADFNRYVRPQELGLADELLTGLSSDGDFDLQKPIRLRTLFQGLNTNGAFKQQLRITDPMAEREHARIILIAADFQR